MPVTVASTTIHKGVGVEVELRLDQKTYIMLSGDLLKLTCSAAPNVTTLDNSISWKEHGGPVAWTVRLGGSQIISFIAPGIKGQSKSASRPCVKRSSRRSRLSRRD